MLATIMQRFPYMDNEQALYTMFTTSVADTSDYEIGMRREAARNARIYAGSLLKRGDGTPFLTGNVTLQETTEVESGKLSVVGTHLSQVVVKGGTLGGSGLVSGGINVVTGLLQPGLLPEEAAGNTDVPVTPGQRALGGRAVHITRRGGYVATIRGNTDYTQVVTSSNVILQGNLLLSVVNAPSPGTVQTIMRGRRIVGTFAGLPEGSVLAAGANRFRISYKYNQVTLTALAG